MADETGQIGVVLICGIPAAGKSSFAQKLHRYVQEIMESSFHAIYVCYDDLIPSDLDLYGCSKLGNSSQNVLDTATEYRVEKSGSLDNYSLWKQYRKFILKAVEKIMNLIQSSPCENGDEGCGSNPKAVEVKREGSPGFQEFWDNFLRDISRKDRKCSCIERGSSSWRWNGTAHVILVDDNMFYHSMRYEYVQLARKYRTGFAEVFLKCSLEIAEKRNSSRSHPVSSDTMKNMFGKMEPPEPDKFPWERFNVTINSEEQWDIKIMESVTCLIRGALKHPEIISVEDYQEKERSRMACITSIVYQTDQVLRKYVTRAITEAKGSFLWEDEIGNLELIFHHIELKKERLGDWALRYRVDVTAYKGQSESFELVRAVGITIHFDILNSNIKTRGSGKGKKELQSLAAELNKQKKAFLDSLHSIKGHSECSSKYKRTLAPKKHFPEDHTEFTRDNSSERTLNTVCKESVTSDEKKIALVQGSTPHFENIMAGHLKIGDSRSHFCLNCFPDVEDKEEFKSFVQELFNEMTQS